jgi:hypothetical protein
MGNRPTYSAEWAISDCLLHTHRILARYLERKLKRDYSEADYRLVSLLEETAEISRLFDREGRG